ncbi:hypothetical protein [Flavobacterium sp. ENC]|uniref:hypothetical protein n=1 Tax=Flavobacterium sp. ENC TaxID=2897330 RepID=UPI001E5A9D09|nr:hypothetical protein [Flavobacterium sp. ENC]MCD0465975.1 hypothetical protein [Flavobacterium sp. ENC]
MNKNSHLFKSRKALKVFLKAKRRKKKLKNIKHKGSVHLSQNLTRKYTKRKFIGHQSKIFKKKPEYNDVIKFLIPHYKKFSERQLPANDDGNLIVPKTFSISENTEESMYFLKRLFHCLHSEKPKLIIVDYILCEYLDVDASACMDLILEGFINYYNKCLNKGHKVKIDRILPKNFETKPNIKNVLFSIGAYKNLKQFEMIKSPDADFIAFNLRIGDKQQDKTGILKEIHETEIVDYVIDCLASSGHVLTSIAEGNLSKVVGEVMANAEEHSNFRYRYAIGYFMKPNKINNDLGVFKLSIFNFGQTIYESFSKNDNCNSVIVEQMADLSQQYTTKRWFKKAKFEEETLWTLYSLQEGVTSMRNWKRGKGTIRFIDRFFKLKGDDCNDNVSKLTLISGNSKIIFDGTYPLQEIIKGNDEKPMQVMTFNNSGNISELPNDKYVTFVPPTFPGTLITAKICLTNKNII